MHYIRILSGKPKKSTKKHKTEPLVNKTPPFPSGMHHKLARGAATPLPYGKRITRVNKSYIKLIPRVYYLTNLGDIIPVLSYAL